MEEAPTLLGEIYSASRNKMRDASLTSYEEYTECVDEVIDERIDKGLMTEDEDTKALREGLERMYWQTSEDAEPEVFPEHSEDSEE
ncbi:MAG: hypothetical protein WC289_02935 [Patescibacteria group bacterium]|jgi:polyhydroxyalkanoate synthesis regulator phasin